MPIGWLVVPANIVGLQVADEERTDSQRVAAVIERFLGVDDALGGGFLRERMKLRAAETPPPVSLGSPV